MVLAVSLVLGAISLMGLSQGEREQRGYQALSRAAVAGISDEQRATGGLEDPQQQQQQQPQVANSPVCSINSGTKYQNQNQYSFIVPQTICLLQLLKDRI